MDTQGVFHFIRGLMLHFPSPFPSFLVTGKALSDETGSFSLVPKTELQGLSNKKAESYYYYEYVNYSFMIFW